MLASLQRANLTSFLRRKPCAALCLPPKSAHPDALFVGIGPFFLSRRLQLAHWATRVAIPATFGLRQYAEAGGLMSYRANFTDAWRHVGGYTGQILKGAKPADLPVMQATKFEFVINLQTARALGIEVPNSIQLLADELIE